MTKSSTTPHENLSLKRMAPVRKATVAEAIEKDGTLIIEVRCTYVVSHAAYCEVTDETLAGLIESQGTCATNVDRFHIIEANND